jgi:hypothetical protein
MGHRADAHKRADELTQAQTKAEAERTITLRDKRETELREAVRTLRVSHSCCVTAANDYANAILDAEADEEAGMGQSQELDAQDDRIEELFKTSYLAAREEAENLRAVSRAGQVRDEVDSLIDKMRELHESTGNPPDDQASALNQLSGEVSDLVRKVSAAVDTEIQTL